MSLDYDDDLADSGYYDEYVDTWDEAPYCDECGRNLVSGGQCPMSRCKRDNPHCPNTNCGASSHCGEDWI